MLRRPAAFRRTRAAAARPTATTPERLTSRFHSRSSKAARICARRTTADATGRQRDTRSRSILPPVILAFDASGEEPLTHHKKGERRNVEYRIRCQAAIYCNAATQDA